MLHDTIIHDSCLCHGATKTRVGTKHTFTWHGWLWRRAIKKELKIKPKAQWDRYTDMKKVPMVRVAVRKTDTDDWLEVGRVRAKDKVTTEIAVARQRALIADVSKHVFVSRSIARTVCSSYPRLCFLFA